MTKEKVYRFNLKNGHQLTATFKGTCSQGNDSDYSITNVDSGNIYYLLLGSHFHLINQGDVLDAIEL